MNLISLIMILGLTACGNSAGDAGSTEDTDTDASDAINVVGISSESLC